MVSVPVERAGLVEDSMVVLCGSNGQLGAVQPRQLCVLCRHSWPGHVRLRFRCSSRHCPMICCLTVASVWQLAQAQWRSMR